MITGSVNVDKPIGNKIITRILPIDPRSLFTVAYDFNSQSTAKRMHCVKCCAGFPHHMPGCPEEKA